MDNCMKKQMVSKSFTKLSFINIESCMSPHGRVAVTLGIALHPLLAYAFWLAPEPNRMRRSTQGGC